MSFPKIVYTPEGGTEQTLSLLFPPQQQPGYEKTAVRHDNVSAAGVRESVVERVEEFLEISLDSVQTGTDLANWRAFLDHALTGAAFAYYPDAAQPAFTNYLLEDTGANLEYKSPGRYTLKVKMRKQVS
ncbi:MAG: hypothetical protein LAN62_14940 [Acidobacteriia bacterium]|nr:hypothetical protein [Terriglobia bacterium]